MSEFIGYNADRGTWYEADFEDDGTARIHTQQDCQPVLDRLKKLRNSDAYQKKGMKEELFHLCSIPAGVELALRDRGINIYNRHQINDVLKIIDEEYPYLKATRKKHRVNLS